MRKVERNVVQPPNQQLQGLASTRSTTPQARAAQSHEPNSKLFSGDAGGSLNLTRQPSPVAPVNHRFNVDEAQMAQPAAAIDPGKGAIPINPFLASRPDVVRARSLPDDAKQR